MKWSMPTVYRVGDKPAAGLFIFSQQDNEPVALVTKFAGAEMRQTLTLHKGANYLTDAEYSAIWLVKCRTATKWASAGQH
ncbi:hypothetical protein ACLB1N_14050 [Escherichia coli]